MIHYICFWKGKGEWNDQLAQVCWDLPGFCLRKASDLGKLRQLVTLPEGKEEGKEEGRQERGKNRVCSTCLPGAQPCC